MPVGDSLSESVGAGSFRWHVIAELDVARLVVRHRRLRGLCDRLEACADVLPARPPAGIVSALGRELGSRLRVDFAGDRDFLRGNFESGRAARLDRTLLREVADRHAVCSDHASDVVAALCGDRNDACPPSPETIGYMLRSFFEGCRDALVFEELAILKLGRLRLTTTARDMLVDCLCGARR